MGPLEGFVLTVLGFFFVLFAWSLVFLTIMSVVKLLTGYEWDRKGKGRGAAWLQFAVFVGGFALFIKLLDS